MQNGLLQERLIDLVISIVLGAMSYTATLYLIERQTFNDLLGMVMNRF